jgi:hypothetical protein
MVQACLDKKQDTGQKIPKAKKWQGCSSSDKTLAQQMKGSEFANLSKEEKQNHTNNTSLLLTALLFINY